MAKTIFCSRQYNEQTLNMEPLFEYLLFKSMLPLTEKESSYKIIRANLHRSYKY